MTTWWRTGRLLALIVAVLVTAGLNLSSVQANTMSVEMGKMQGMVSDPSSCTTCPMNPDGSQKPMACAPVCMAAVTVLPGQQAIYLMSNQAVATFPSPASPLHGRDFLPDPYPPRTAI